MGVLNNENVKGHILSGSLWGLMASGLVQNSPSSPVLRLLEGKTTYCLLRPEGRHSCLAHGAYWHDVSREKWRARRWWIVSTDPMQVSPNETEGRSCLNGEARCVWIASSSIVARARIEEIPESRSDCTVSLPVKLTDLVGDVPQKCLVTAFSIAE